jgi:CubicO group peptidase (beta-lactamase class C family)
MIDLGAVAAACSAQAGRQTPGIDDMESYLAAQVADTSHREVTGPLLPGTGASGVVVHQGRTVGEWGDPTVPEMCFSATKSFVTVVAGVAHRDGLLDLDALVADTVALPVPTAGIRWRHLLQQTSQWHGELWGKPTDADAQSGDAPPDDPPGSVWAYNDVRVNLLCLALTTLCGRSLPAVLAESVMAPLGGTDTWSWHGYHDSHVRLGGERVPVVSGGAHWGGGLWMSAADLALIGRLHLDAGMWDGDRLLGADWVDETWRPCPVRPEYGLLWWLNDTRQVFPEAPASGRCARGNGGRHLVWVDRQRDLVIVSHWGDDVGRLLAEVSAAVG